MKFQKLPIDSLVPVSYNSRTNLKPGDSEFEKIKNTITKLGYVDPVIVNQDLIVIGGHRRLSVLKTLGYFEIDCVVSNIDKTKEKALNVALNKISGEWNKELLAELITELQSLIACEQTNRICHTIEMDEKYVDVIVRRYIEHIGSTDGVFLLRDGVRLSYPEVTMA